MTPPLPPAFQDLAREPAPRRPARADSHKRLQGLGQLLSTPSQDRGGDLQHARLTSWPIDHWCSLPPSGSKLKIFVPEQVTGSCGGNLSKSSRTLSRHCPSRCFVLKLKKRITMHQLGIEPGSLRWQRCILPLDHWCLANFLQTLHYQPYDHPLLPAVKDLVLEPSARGPARAGSSSGVRPARIERVLGWRHSH